MTAMAGAPSAHMGIRHGRYAEMPYCPKKRRTARMSKTLANPDPLQLLLAQLLTSTRADMLKLRDKARELITEKLVAAQSFNTLEKRLNEFTAMLSSCQEAAHWMYNPEIDASGLPFEETCIALRRDPDAIREKTFDGLPAPLVRLVVSGQLPDWEQHGQS
jgi:hypothetical protein